MGVFADFLNLFLSNLPFFGGAQGLFFGRGCGGAAAAGLSAAALFGLCINSHMTDGSSMIFPTG